MESKGGGVFLEVWGWVEDQGKFCCLLKTFDIRKMCLILGGERGCCQVSSVSCSVYKKETNKQAKERKKI